MQSTLPTPLPRQTRASRYTRSPWRLSILATLIAGAMLLPFAYLLIRGIGAGRDDLTLLLNWSTLRIAWNSVLLATLVTGFSLALALPLAWLTVRTDLPGRRLWTVLTTLPLVFPSYVGSFALVAMLGPRGMLQGWLEPLGVERLPSIYGLTGATWVLTSFTYPYLLLSIRAGLRRLDPALDEAARNLGLNAWQSFLRITLPSLRPAMTAGGLLVALYALSDFGAVAMLRYTSFTRAIYINFRSSFDRNQGALFALVLVAMTVLLLIASQRVRGRRVYEGSSRGTARAVRPVALGRWKVPALIFCALVVTAALIVPTGVIVYWLVRGLLAGEPLLATWRALLHSIQAAALAAGVATLCAVPVAYFAVRFPSRYSSVISESVYLGYGLPGIVIALSLVFFGANYAPVFYQTLMMLIFAYVVRFLPQALGNVRTSLLQISPRLEEASRSLGLNRRRTLWRVIVPLLQPGIWAGAALVFLTTLKELPATLLLGPTGFDTLATQIWSATAEAFFARAAAPALILLVVSALSIFIILGQEEGN